MSGEENQEVPQQFGVESDTSHIKIKKENVTDKDIFRLAKQILLFCAGLFIIVGFLKVYFNDTNKGVIDVWEFSKIILNSITSLVLGLYFGKKAS